MRVGFRGPRLRSVPALQPAPRRLSIRASAHPRPPDPSHHGPGRGRAPAGRDGKCPPSSSLAGMQQRDGRAGRTPGSTPAPPLACAQGTGPSAAPQSPGPPSPSPSRAPAREKTPPCPPPSARGGGLFPREAPRCPAARPPLPPSGPGSGEETEGRRSRVTRAHTARSSIPTRRSAPPRRSGLKGREGPPAPPRPQPRRPGHAHLGRGAAPVPPAAGAAALSGGGTASGGLGLAWVRGSQGPWVRGSELQEAGHRDRGRRGRGADRPGRCVRGSDG